mmetsp:Transcript_12093/g.17385  ORF Transcript_12093/g.17385 Transcript_12093/m.17385 type:complete len:372 (+) Transcript_12093:195-1310(+)|eukprot:CAMPEP_0201699702 /NCGR_PEP_ID=MMETSP0578-20130828/25127_1 /ASSEMBLY_ACC=CAM_ASM_000663 /TAXON_ID=267565 /ORGANISM="Skeletonema grethea, Strain CCMP 1804" /LENGTH=371 /DNA_ID=CAMNT_0048186535 /DNA_START=190 /DNA_END=1305 /DNA_ORIENTATION=+
MKPNSIAPHRYYYIRVTPNGNESTERYDVIDINDVSSQIQLFKKQVPCVDPSYTVNTHAKNADSSLITALQNSKCLLNLNSIVDVRNAAGVLGDQTDLCCFAASVKSQFHIREAVNRGINRMTVTYPAEVLRIAAVSKTIELVLQITPSSEDSIVVQKDTGAQKSCWTKILQTASSKGIYIVGISLGRNVSSDYAKGTERISQAFSNVIEAYELASQYGHSVSFVDLGCLISDFQNTYPTAHERCSTITEEIGDEDDSDVEENHSTWESDDRPGEDTLLSTLFETYLPRSLGIQVFAQHAQYLVPDHEKILKWWSMPKVRRPTASLHSYLAGGCSCSSNAKPLNRNASLAYLSRKQETCNILKNPPAAAQA